MGRRESGAVLAEHAINIVDGRHSSRAGAAKGGASSFMSVLVWQVVLEGNSKLYGLGKGVEGSCAGRIPVALCGTWFSVGMAVRTSKSC